MIIMSEKKRRWLSIVYSDSQENNTDTDISWSSSDSNSEDNTNSFTHKRIKITKWLELHHLEQKVRNVNMTPPRTIEVLTRDEFLESPVINEVKPEDESPVLTQSEPRFLQELSPVISTNKVVRKIRLRSKRKKTETNKTQIITDDFNSSPVKTQFSISPANTDTEPSQPHNIDPVPSQHVSGVISNDSSSSYSDLKALYHQPPPKRKRFKTGSLASQLQKAVNLQSSSTAIWQHEMFLSKSKGEEMRTNAAEEIDFIVLKKWKEYSCTILECRYLKKSKLPEVENDRNFLITVGIHNPSNICFEPNESYRIFPPFLRKIVKYELKETLCLIDGCRFDPL